VSTTTSDTGASGIGAVTPQGRSTDRRATPGGTGARRRGTGDRTTFVLGLAALVTLGITAWLGLSVTPPDVTQGQLVRLIYIHPAAATMCYIGFGLCAVSSLAWLWPRTRSQRWDALAGASAEVGVVFCAATLVSGSIWGRGSWGVWWTWDARLTLTALLFAVFLGYLALRRTGGEPQARAKRCAITAVLCFVVVPVDHEATTWWTTLHQGNTLLRSNPMIHGSQLATMAVSFVAFGLLFAWLTLHRYRVELLEERFETEGFAAAIAERRAEGAWELHRAEGASELHRAEGASELHRAEGASELHRAEGSAP
jgi:heme exporter protein C